jgi:Tol biopolymer transport system component
MMIGCLLTFGGCGAEGTGPTFPSGDEHGTIQVVVQTSGVEVNPNGYTLLVGDTPGITIGLNDSVALSVPPGGITLVLGEVPVTCDPVTTVRSRDGTVTLSETVWAGQRRVVTFDIACTGKDIVFARVSAGNRHELFRMNVDGSGLVQITSDAGPVIWHPRWSPDGTKIAYASDALSSNNAEIFVTTADGVETTPLCCGGDPESLEFDLSPTWSPDGQMIAWSAFRPDSLLRGIYRMSVDGTDRVQLTVGRDGNPDWGPDGRILFTRQVNDPSNGADLYVMGPSGDNVTLLVEGVEAGAAWSPDGQTLVFTRVEGEGDAQTIWTVPEAGGQVRQRKGEPLEAQPRWSPDGMHLVFHYGTDRNLSSATRGICVGPVEGTTCDHLTAQAGGSAVDVFPDWRRSSETASARAAHGAAEPHAGSLTAGDGGR